MLKEKMRDFLETERLVLFPLTKENLHLFNTDLSSFEEFYDIVYDGEELDNQLLNFLKELENDIVNDEKNYLFFTEFYIVLKENSHVIGSIDYKYIPNDGVTEIGYGLNPIYQGNGYMSEALKEFLKFGKSLGIKKVLADTEPNNIRSQNTLKRCGFKNIYTKENLWWEIDL